MLIARPHNMLRLNQAGYSLVELMIAIVLGMLVVGASLGIYISAYGANSTSLKMARLNNDLRTAMTFITRDIRRAGYDANITGGNISDFESVYFAEGERGTGGAADDDDGDGLNEGNSIVFTYDVNSDGTLTAGNDYYDTNANSTLDPGEGAIGFSYDATNKAIEMRTGSASWEDFTDPDVIRITAFTITEISPPSISNGSSNVQSRSFIISISGELVRDSSVKRSIQEVVRIRSEVVS